MKIFFSEQISPRKSRILLKIKTVIKNQCLEQISPKIQRIWLKIKTCPAKNLFLVQISPKRPRIWPIIKTVHNFFYLNKIFKTAMNSVKNKNCPSKTDFSNNFSQIAKNLA